MEEIRLKPGAEQSALAWIKANISQALQWNLMASPADAAATIAASESHRKTGTGEPERSAIPPNRRGETKAAKALAANAQTLID